MGDRIHAVGRLTTLPIAIGVVVGAIFRHLGSDVLRMIVVGAAIAVPVFVLLMRYLRKQDDGQRNGRA